MRSSGERLRMARPDSYTHNSEVLAGGCNRASGLLSILRALLMQRKVVKQCLHSKGRAIPPLSFNAAGHQEVIP